MVSISDKWNVLKKGDVLSQKFMDSVKPEAPLKNRLNTAQKKLQLQITRLAEIDDKLKTKHDAIFEEIVDSKKSNNETYAKVYANKDAMNLIETKPSLDRHKNIGEAPKKEKVAEAAPEETNEEEVSEEDLSLIHI